MQQFLKESGHMINTPKTKTVNRESVTLSPQGDHILGTKKQNRLGRTDGSSAALILPENLQSAITKIR